MQRRGDTFRKVQLTDTAKLSNGSVLRPYNHWLLIPRLRSADFFFWGGGGVFDFGLAKFWRFAFLCEFFSECLRLPPKKSTPKFTPKSASSPLQFHIFEPNIFHVDFLLAGEMSDCSRSPVDLGREPPSEVGSPGRRCSEFARLSCRDCNGFCTCGWRFNVQTRSDFKSNPLWLK